MTFQQPTERQHGSSPHPAGFGAGTQPRDLEAQVTLVVPDAVEGAGDWFHDCDFSPSGTQLATGQGKTAHIWDLATGRPSHLLEHPRVVQTVRFSPDGRLLATGCQNETVRLWDVASGQAVSVLPQTGGPSAFPSLAFSPDGQHLLTGDSDGARIWDLSRMAASRPVAPACIHGWKVAYSPDGAFFAVADHTTVNIHDAATHVARQTLPRPDQAGPLAFSPDGTTLATAAFKNTSIHGLATGATRQTLTNPTAWADDVVDLAFSPDGRLLATANWAHTARIWDVATADLLFTLVGHDSPVFSVAFAPDGSSVATCGTDSVRLWTLPEH